MTTRGNLSPSERRRANVKRLRREGRPVGHAHIGFRLVGPTGSRREVVDPAAQEVLAEIVRARDVLALSWDRVSDHVDAFVARRDGRARTPRWDRRPWSKAQCWDWYHRAKALQAAGSPDNVKAFRRCVVCGQSKPIEEFSWHHNGRRRYRRRVCKTCRAMRTFRRREAQRREKIVRALHELAVVAEKYGPDSPQARGALEEFAEVSGDVGRHWWEAWHQAQAKGRSGRMTLDMFRLLLVAAKEERKAIEEIQGWPDEDLERAINQYVQRHFPEVLADDSVGHSDGR